MAYADASPADIEGRLRATPKATPKRKRKAARTSAKPTEAAIWPSIRSRTKGLTTKKAGALFRAIARKLGAAILSGLLDPPKKPQPKPVDALLLALDRSAEVRSLIGRVDVSGASDAAAWAKIIKGQRGPELHVWYRHGREVLSGLLDALERVAIGAGRKVRSIWKRIERARQFGGSAFVAIIPLMADATPPPAAKSSRSRKISATRKAPA